VPAGRMDRPGWPVAGGVQASPDPAWWLFREPAGAGGGLGGPEEGLEGVLAGLAEKSRSAMKWRSPYRRPTLVGWGQSPKVDERSSVKELGKLAP
jgi:hypothetical protein